MNMNGNFGFYTYTVIHVVTTRNSFFTDNLPGTTL